MEGKRNFMDKQKQQALRKTWILWWLILSFSAGWAQGDKAAFLATIRANKGDTSEVKALNGMYRLEFRTNPEQAIHYLEDALNLAQEIDYKKGLAMAYRGYGVHHNSRGEHEEAIEALQQCKAIYQGLEDLEGINSCYNGLGNTAARQGNYSLALEQYLSSAMLAEEMENESAMAKAYQNISGIHFLQQQYDKALEYIERALEIKESLGDSIAMVPSLNSMSAVYSAKGNYSEALDIQFRTLKIARKVSNPYEIASIINNIGIQYRHLGRLNSAKNYYHKALNIYKGIDVKQEVAIIYVNLGDLECLLENGDQAIAYFDSSLAIATQIEGREIVAEAFGGLAEAHKVLGNYEQALAWTGKKHSLKDSLKSESVQLNINNLQAQYESGKKDKAIAESQKKEAEAISMAEKRKALLTIAISATLVTLLIMLFFLARRKAKEKQRRVELEQKVLRSQMNPHFIFNSLGAIQQMFMNGDIDLANNYLGDFGKLMRNILENSGKESISVKEELEMLKLYLDLEQGRNSGLIEYEFFIDERIDRFGTHIPPMLIQPFVENAIWHGILPNKKKGKINIHLKVAGKGDSIICEIEDNGLGISQSITKEGHNSKGIQITEQRIGRKVKFTNLSPGTRVTIHIPI